MTALGAHPAQEVCNVSVALMYVHQVILGEEGVILFGASRTLQGKLFIVGWGFYDIHTNSGTLTNLK